MKSLDLHTIYSRLTRLLGAERPTKSDFHKTYPSWVRMLKSGRSLDSAMHLSVGGNFEAIGILERELLIELGLEPTGYVIDVGCGSGRLAHPLSEYLSGKYLGIDVVPELVAYARNLVRRPDWRFEVADGLVIPEQDGTANVVCFFSVFTHLLHEQSYAYLQEAKRVLKPDGKIVFSFLEFAVPHHWYVFEENRKAIDNDSPLNMFVSRDAIEAWALHLNMKIELIERGDEPYISLSEPVVFEDGTVAEGKASLGQSVCVLAKPGPRTAGRFGRALNHVLTPEPWCVDAISYDGSVFEISGWALAPEGRHDLLAFTLNDREFKETQFPLPRGDLQNVFWYKAGAGEAAFHCRSQLHMEEAFIDGHATLKCINRETGLPFREEYTLYYPDESGPELPDAGRRIKESGSDSAALYRLEGFSTFKKLDLALRKNLEMTLGDFRDILDWGCGCGRSTRYFHSLPRTRVVGIDVDLENITWCREHFSFGEYRVAPFRPPTDFEPESFELIIGISVLTHLSEKLHQEWIGELRRIAKPGAAVLVSTQGESTVGRSSWSEDVWDRWHQTGFLAGDSSSNPDDAPTEEDNSVNAYITEDYVRRNWSQAFEILDFIPGYIGNHQDLVLMRKRE